MVQAIAIPLPAFINEESIEERIKDNLAKSLKDRRANVRNYPEHVLLAMPTVVKEQVRNLLQRDYNTLWDLKSPAALITDLPPNFEGKDFYDVTSDDVSEIGRYLVGEIYDAIDTSCRLVGGAAGALESQGFPKAEDLSRPL